MNIKEKLYDFKVGTLKALKNTSIEIAILGLVGLGIGTYHSVVQENARTKKIPLSFSEIGQTMRDAQYAGNEYGSINMYLQATNDLAMKVFECHNLAHEDWSLFRTGFAEELYNKMDLKNIYLFNLQQLLDSVPKMGTQVKKDLEDQVNARDRLKVIYSDMEESWRERHVDNYHTVCNTTTDSDGNSTTTCHQVYDDTDHYFYYTPAKGISGVKKGLELFANIDDLDLHQEIRTASQTNADGEHAAEKSRDLGDEKEVKVEDYQGIADSWKESSTLVVNQKNIPRLFSNLEKETLAWDNAKETAKKRYHWNTYSSYHSGPKEFQIAEKMTHTSRDLHNNIDEGTVLILLLTKLITLKVILKNILI